jgi:hypothetical protein
MRADEATWRGLSRTVVWASFAAMCLGWAGMLAGCGPIRSTTRISKAEAALERARVAEAYEKAPYEFYKARYYLHKAREEWGYSNFQASYTFADEARQSAESALRETREDPWSDPVEGRNRSYGLSESETIGVDPEEVEEVESMSTSDSKSDEASSDADGAEESKSEDEGDE